MQRIRHITTIIASTMILISCNTTGKSDSSEDYEAPVGATISSEEISIEPDTICDNLPSYYESTIYVNQSGDTCILGYNYKTHELDILNLSTRKFRQPISLDRQGPNGIIGDPIWFHQISADSILIGTEEQTAYLIDTIGRVMESYSFRGEGHSTASRNARTHIAALSYDGKTGKIFYPREEGKELSISALDIRSGHKTKVGDIPGWSQRKVGFMIYPNIAYTDSTALINFPYENKVSEMSLIDGSIIRQSGHPMTLMTEETVDPGESVDEIIWRGYANPFYADVNYLPAANMFAQIVIGPTRSSRNDDETHKAYNRAIFLRLLDRDLRPVHEYEFERNSYLPYAWLYTPDGIILYHDNPLDDTERSEGVLMTRFRVTPVYAE